MQKLTIGLLTTVFLTLAGTAHASASTYTPAFTPMKVAIYNTGTMIYEVGPIPEDFVKKYPGLKAKLAA